MDAHRVVDGGHLLSGDGGVPDGQLSQGAGEAPLRGVIRAPAQHNAAVNLQGLPAIHCPGDTVAACNSGQLGLFSWLAEPSVQACSVRCLHRDVSEAADHAVSCNSGKDHATGVLMTNQHASMQT